MHREGSCSEVAGGLSKVQMLTLVLGVGVFSLLPKNESKNLSLRGVKGTCFFLSRRVSRRLVFDFLRGGVVSLRDSLLETLS